MEGVTDPPEVQRCALKVLDNVARTKQAVLITKGGRPIAKLVPVTPRMRAGLTGSIIEESVTHSGPAGERGL